MTNRTRWLMLAANLTICLAGIGTTAFNMRQTDHIRALMAETQRACRPSAPAAWRAE